MQKQINEQGGVMKSKTGTLHGKPGHISEKLYFYSYWKSYPSDIDDTEQISKHQNFHYDVDSFDSTTVKFLPKLYFCINVLKFLLVWIQIFGALMGSLEIGRASVGNLWDH